MAKSTTPDYLFTSERLGFRNWLPEDAPSMAALNADPEVMRFFPKTQTLSETQVFIDRMLAHHTEKGYCYFAVDVLETNTFIGFIGLKEQTYDAPFTPCVDIGWRLHKNAWGKGYATEGAKRCLTFAFNTLQLSNVKSVCPAINTPSERVMQKAGMTKVGTFLHPALKNSPQLQKCYLYEIKNPKG